MTMPESYVAPPVETPALFGLLSAARLLPLVGHDEFGITYDVVCDNPVRVWPGACRPVIPPTQFTRTITVTLVGAVSGVDPDFVYTIDASATVDGGPARTLRITVDDEGTVEVTTGAAAVEVYSGVAAGVHSVVVVDELTGGTTTFATTQNVDGTLTDTSEVLVVIDGEVAEKLVGASAENVSATPFVVYGVENCLMGLDTAQQVERARQRLALIEQPSVERAFWTGEYGNTSALATGTPTIVGNPAAPVDLTTGLSLLEAWIGQQSGYVGFIHVNRGAAAIAAESQLVFRVGSRAETELGNVWVFGGGYPLTGPTGQAAPTGRQMWMFATRQPTIRRTDVFVPADANNGALNWSKNNVFVVAERVYVIDFPCESAAVKIDLSLCRCDGAL